MVDRILDRLGVRPDQFDPPDPGAEQAVVDLLQLTSLVDGTSSDAERERLRDHLEQRDWPDGINPWSYAEAAMARVRDAMADASALEALLASITARLQRDEDRAFALDLVRELAGIDGTVDAREAALVQGLRRRFVEG
jgi:hypothetical protein